MKIIGLGHYSRTGKDTLANYLINELRSLGHYGVKVPFAWALKDMCYRLYKWAGIRSPAFYDTPEGEKERTVPLAGLGMSPVELWCAAGNAMREVYPSTWIDCVLRQENMDGGTLIIPDVRFPNEVEALREHGATLIKVVRPGFGPKDTVADQALVDYDGWDYVVGGSGSLIELRGWAELFAIWIHGGQKPSRTGIFATLPPEPTLTA